MKLNLTAALPLALLFPAVAAAQTTLFSLDEIVFFGNATETELGRIGNSVSIVTDKELDEAGDLQLTEYLARLPGVSLTQNGPQGGTADIRIRGAQGRYVSVYVDGILVTDPSGTVIAYEDFGGLTTGSIRRIEILRGSQSALYGGTAVGGVINISTLAGDDAPEGTSQTAALEVGSYNTYALSYGLTQRTGPLTLSLGLDHTRSDGFSAGEENTGNTEADGFDRTRLSFGAAYEVTEALTLGMNGFIERGSSDFDEFHDTPVDGSPGDEISERDASGVRAYAIWQAGEWEHSLALSGYRIDRRNASLTLGAGAPGYLAPYDNNFSGRRVMLDYTSSGQVAPTMQLSFGLSGMRETAVYDNVPDDRSRVDTLAVFGEAVWSPVETFDLTATLRHDDHSAFGSFTTGRLAFAWRPSAAWTVRGAVGNGFRPPSIDELYGDYIDELGYEGNPGLVPEESMSVEIGADYRAANGATFSATLFWLDVENLVTYCSAFFVTDPECPTIVLPDPDTLFNVPGTSTRRGVELGGSLPISETLMLTGAYTYTEAQSGSGTRLPLVPTHDIALGIDAEWGNGWIGNLTAQRIVDTLEGATPLPDYTLVNASLGYELSEGVEAYIRVHNLFNEEYQSRRGYGTSDRAVYLGLRARY